ncbi:MAG: hypothetical protein M3Z98_00300 [Candidatus Dormibacteraeota bacterium]|nr:hypothetical protein [Candidatus Dormibacteraeota bacterium]
MATVVTTSATAADPTGHADRVRRTVALLERRGYALSPTRLAEVCLGGPISPAQLLASLPRSDLEVESGLVVSSTGRERAEAIRRRQAAHGAAAPAYLAEAESFGRSLAGWFPFVTSVSIAGSLASGGFRETDDVDLNLVVEDGYRHLAYVVLNLLGIAHALRHRGKPVDAHSTRPVAPRVMTANLILERSQCFPLARQDEDMAYELLASRTVVGGPFLATVVAANGGLVEHFPQLGAAVSGGVVAVWPRLSVRLFPALLDRPAKALGRAAWRYMQWTRRHRPEAVARVAFVRSTMRPYALFDD